MEIAREYRYSVWLLQFISILLLSIYEYMTQPLYPLNIVWFGASLLLFVAGLFRDGRQALLLALIAILLYTAFQMYRLYVALEVAEMRWNDIIWLPVFPLMAVTGGMGRFMRKAAAYSADRTFSFGLTPEQEDTLTVDGKPGFVTGTAFVYELEEKIIASLRERRRLDLLLVEIVGFRDYKRALGVEQSRLLLEQVADLLSIDLIKSSSKAQLGEGTFAALLENALEPGEDEIGRMKEELNDRFLALMLTRPRREVAVKVRLAYGTAQCPADGIEARSLLDKARDELQWNEV